MSLTEIILWIVLGILLLITFIFTIYLLIPNTITTMTSLPIPCTISANKLPNVSTLITCRNFSGVSDPQRYYDPINNWTVLRESNARFVPSAESICAEYCTLVDSSFNCISNDLSYQQCINKLKPTNCTDPALPVAANGLDRYYVIGRGKVSCYT
jgi:hypothetical protein